MTCVGLSNSTRLFPNPAVLRPGEKIENTTARPRASVRYFSNAPKLLGRKMNQDVPVFRFFFGREKRSSLLALLVESGEAETPCTDGLGGRFDREA